MLLYLRRFRRKAMIYILNHKSKQANNLIFFLKKFVFLPDSKYFCVRFESVTDGPFVYRLGRQVFILERGVRFP